MLIGKTLAHVNCNAVASRCQISHGHAVTLPKNEDTKVVILPNSRNPPQHNKA